MRLISLTELAAIFPRCSLYAPFPRWPTPRCSHVSPTFAHPDDVRRDYLAASLPPRRSSHARRKRRTCETRHSRRTAMHSTNGRFEVRAANFTPHARHAARRDGTSVPFACTLAPSALNPTSTDLTFGLRFSVLPIFPPMHFMFCFSFNMATRGALCCVYVCVCVCVCVPSSEKHGLTTYLN